MWLLVFILLPGIKFIKDFDHITVVAYPHNNRLAFTLYETNFKNHCPECQSLASLNIKEDTLLDPQGTIICENCLTEYDAVEGNTLKKDTPKALIPVPGISSNKPSSTSIELLKEELEKIDNLNKPRKYENSEYKGSLQIPLYNIYPAEVCKISEKIINIDMKYFINEVKCDITNHKMELSLFNHRKPPENKYTPVNKKKKRKKLGKNHKLGFKASSSIEKKIMLKGKQLKNPKSIYKWLNKTNGSGGWRYKYYSNHIKGENVYKFAAKSAEHCWKHKRANCVDFAWIYYTMCKGCGVKVEIWKGTAKFHGRTYGHFWNKHKGRIIDCSTATGHQYSGHKIK